MQVTELNEDLLFSLSLFFFFPSPSVLSCPDPGADDTRPPWLLCSRDAKGLSSNYISASPSLLKRFQSFPSQKGKPYLQTAASFSLMSREHGLHFSELVYETSDPSCRTS